MLTVSELIQQTSKFRAIVSNADESEVFAHADELLLFLNRLQDFFHYSLKEQTPLPSINKIIYGLESNPEVTLQDRSVRERLLNLFVRLYYFDCR
jgi:hypothetical protein